MQRLLKYENWLNYYNTSDPATFWDIIHRLIQKHLDIMCPIKIRKNSPPWITHDIVEAINDRNMLFKIAHNNKTEENIRVARLQRNRVNHLINVSKATYIK